MDTGQSTDIGFAVSDGKASTEPLPRHKILLGGVHRLFDVLDGIATLLLGRARSGRLRFDERLDGVAVGPANIRRGASTRYQTHPVRTVARCSRTGQNVVGAMGHPIDRLPLVHVLNRCDVVCRDLVVDPRDEQILLCSSNTTSTVQVKHAWERSSLCLPGRSS